MMEMANDNRDGNRGGDGMEKAAQGWDGMGPQGKQHPTDSSSNMDTRQLYKNDGIDDGWCDDNYEDNNCNE